ncbi:GNAT family N-acetyltransferase [Dysgonomonas macrotermitis]|uniref:Acetyltransferase (GNAT) family protein n=1 Tax=Dysgonomonas macrotermitis TaxID=1346286 RepID=A0A1M5AWY9_9BACT|nr:GNAT family N-acetyltransferase [Dysgonomonas macrotermitis]SHF34442.1 Acetyltransferase (GNAT) family protein [Dysgonomonas macrotermitis]
MNNFTHVDPNKDLSDVMNTLNVSHGTVAKDFGFTKETNPTNNAFIDVNTLKFQLNNGIDLYTISNNDKLVGCIAIERSSREAGTFYIEKVSVIPEFRNQGYGLKLMDFATSKIKILGAKAISVSLIDSNIKLKKWYLAQGFIESGFKDFEHLPFRVCFMRKEIK